MLRRQPPVWSPLSFGALVAGVRAAWLGGSSAALTALRRRLEAEYRPRAVWLLDSGTSALTVALRAVHAHTAAPLALPAYSCFDVATAADGAGVPFHLYDLDPATLSPDFDSLREALEAGARGVVVAHLYGVPANLAAVQELLAPYGAILIEDAAQGSGCRWGGRAAGSFGALSVLSFGRGKGWTGGRGGALLVHDPALELPASESLGLIRPSPGSPADLVRLVAQWLLARPALYWIPAGLPFLGLGETRYRPPRPVRGITSLAAGVLVSTAAEVAQEVGGRARRASVLSKGLRRGEGIQPPGEWLPGWLRYPVVLQDTALRGEPSDLARAGVVRGYPSTLADLPGFGVRRINMKAELPGARKLAAGLVTVPTHRFVQDAALPAF